MLWVYNTIEWIVLGFGGTMLFWFISGLIVFHALLNQSSILMPIFLFILVVAFYVALICFFLPKLILKIRRKKIDAISNEDERANELVKFYFACERKEMRTAIRRSFFNGGKNNRGKIAGGVAQGTFNTVGTVLSMTGLPGGGLVKAAMGGMGNLANKGIQTATETVNSAMNTANAALNNSKTASNLNYKVVDRGILDEELDEILKKRMTKLGLLQNGIDSLQLDETQISELPPVCLENYCLDKTNENLFIAKGKDGIIRTSCYQANCLYFTAEQLGICQYTFDISDGINYQGETTKEYFWQDITDFSSETGSSMQNGQKGIAIKTSSGLYQCTYRETPEIERSIKGMSAYYREIKKKLVE